MPNPLYDALFASGAPDAVALRVGDSILTYAGLQRQTAAMAGALAALGVRPGDRVAAQIGKSPSGLVLYLATIGAGGIFLPLNPAYTPAELAWFLADAKPALIVCDPDRRAAVADSAAGAAVVSLDGGGQGELADLAAGAPRLAAADREPGDLAAICYTSGTTGRSKGAMLSHGNLVANALTLRDVWRFTGSDVLIHALPTFHVHGLFVATHVALTAGASMIFQPRFEPRDVLRAMEGATCLMGVPTFYTRLLAETGLDRAAARTMRLFISGSAPLLVSTHEAWRARTGHAILERYGMTETGMNASNPCEGERRAGTVGPALPDVSLRIADPATGAPLGAGAIGGVEVRGPNVFSGYWRNPAGTAEAFRPDGFFITGDVGALDESGYLTIVGREKDLVITGGLNVYPREVEDAIDACPGVLESAVFGLPHADLGEAVTAAVVRLGAPPTDEPAIITALAATLARFKQPWRVLFVDALPRNAMGKVQKAELRARYADLYAAAGVRLEHRPETST